MTNDLKRMTNDKLKMSNEIIYTFIDSQNLNLAIKNDIYDNSGNLIYRGWLRKFAQYFAFVNLWEGRLKK